MNENSMDPVGFRVQMQTVTTGTPDPDALILTPEQLGKKIAAIIAGNMTFDDSQCISLTIETCNEAFERQESIIWMIKNGNKATQHTCDYTRNYWVGDES